MRKALERIEARRVALEREIIADMEARFFTEPAPDITAAITHSGSGHTEAPSGTGVRSPFEVLWLA